VKKKLSRIQYHILGRASSENMPHFSPAGSNKVRAFKTWVFAGESLNQNLGISLENRNFNLSGSASTDFKS
jgi:hypothetical protein